MSSKSHEFAHFCRRTSRRALIVVAWLVIALPLAGPAAAHEFKLGELEIVHPWSRETPAGAKVAAGYMVIKNHGSSPDRLIGLSSEIAGKTEVHQMAVDAAGVMTMRPLAEGIEIPAGGEVALKPGSFHIMFMNLKQPPRKGEMFSGVLTFEKAGSVTVKFAVDAIGAAMDHDM